MRLKKIINYPFIKKIINFIFKFLSEEMIIKLQYRVTLKRKLNLNPPKRFTEKIQWYKLNHRIPLMTQCVDKYLVRDYIQEKGFENTLVKLYQVCENFDEINFEKLPNKFVIKSNKGSGTNVLIKDKKSMNFNAIKREVQNWDTLNTVLYGQEWAYKNVKHRIVIEELLEDNENENGEIHDYKFMCFNGAVKFIWVDAGRSTNHKRNFYDINWNMIDVKSDVLNTQEIISKPGGFDYMLEIAELIGQDFPFARVDFYWVNGKVYFGEITFYPWSGCIQFTPDKFDYVLGNELIIPEDV